MKKAMMILTPALMILFVALLDKEAMQEQQISQSNIGSICLILGMAGISGCIIFWSGKMKKYNKEIERLSTLDQNCSLPDNKLISQIAHNSYNIVNYDQRQLQLFYSQNEKTNHLDLMSADCVQSCVCGSTENSQIELPRDCATDPERQEDIKSMV